MNYKNIMTEILKVEDWLKFRHPDYAGFQFHVETWEKIGLPYGYKDLVRISEAYNIEPPKVVNGKLVFKD